MKTGKENMMYINGLYNVINKSSFSKLPFNIHKKIFKFITGFLKIKNKYPDDIQLIDINVSNGDIMLIIQWNNNRTSYIPLVNIFDGFHKVNVDKLLYKNNRIDINEYPKFYTKENIVTMIEYLRHILRFGNDEGFDFKNYLASYNNFKNILKKYL